jgi:hypothetical protein
VTSSSLEESGIDVTASVDTKEISKSKVYVFKAKPNNQDVIYNAPVTSDLSPGRGKFGLAVHYFNKIKNEYDIYYEDK